MILGEILALLRDKSGISRLNEMQRRMSEIKAPSIILLAPTGSGKTVAFAIPLLMGLKPAGQGIQAIIMAPSRELVLQIASVIRPLAAGYKTVAFYGGHPMAEEVKSLSVVPDIVVATPGRLLDHINRQTLDPSTVSTLVIDEYDKQLELGFENEMKRICRRLTAVRRLMLTSATPPADYPDWLPLKAEPVTVDFTSARGVRAGRPDLVLIKSPARDKLDTLSECVRALAPQSVIVFANHRESAERIWRRLRADHIPAGLYHGGLDQPERENAIEMFANGSTPVLVSTDLGSRGLDIEGVDAVIHYHMPPSPESWTHRNGRTARQGAPGTVYVIASDDDDIPPYVTTERDWAPTPPETEPDWHEKATIYINLGRKEKISRGDIAGFMIQKGGLRADEVGHIDLRDHCALVAVPRDKAAAVLAAVTPERIKAKRARITLMS